MSKNAWIEYVLFLIALIFIETSGSDSRETRYQLTLLRPPLNSIIYCEPAALEATTNLKISASIISDDNDRESPSPYQNRNQNQLEKAEQNHLLVEIVMDPHLGPHLEDSVSVAHVPLSLLSSASVAVGSLFPGYRTVRIRLLDTAQQNKVIAETTSTFFVQCEDSTFDVSSVLSSYEEGSVDLTEYFQQVYRYKMWSHEEADSGPGSTPAATANISLLIRDLVLGQTGRQSVMSGLHLPPPRHVFDIPCGDLHWIRAHSLLPFLRLHGVTYHGMDVSRDIIALNQEYYHLLQQQQAIEEAGESGKSGGSKREAVFQGRGGGGANDDISFSYLDVVSSPLPAFPAPSLVICRHLMIHLSASDNLTILYKLLSSTAHYLLLTTYVDDDDVISDNKRVFSLFKGHKINLMRRPYCLRPPLLLLEDAAPAHIGLWDIRAYDEHNAGDFFDIPNCRV